LVNQLEQRKIGFKSLQDPVDTTSPGGMLVFHIFGALAEFERNLIRERTKAASDILLE
jgi:DNA invertase Pin-like site-specific DNA recombinase